MQINEKRLQNGIRHRNLLLTGLIFPCILFKLQHRIIFINTVISEAVVKHFLYIKRLTLDPYLLFHNGKNRREAGDDAHKCLIFIGILRIGSIAREDISDNFKKKALKGSVLYGVGAFHKEFPANGAQSCARYEFAEFRQKLLQHFIFGKPQLSHKALGVICHIIKIVIDHHIKLSLKIFLVGKTALIPLKIGYGDHLL